MIMLNAIGDIVSYDAIDETVWMGEHVTKNTSGLLFYRLHQKLPELNIEAIKGVGYRLTI